MSHQQSAPAPQQPSKQSSPAAPNAPQPISHELLRQVSGGTETTQSPNGSW